MSVFNDHIVASHNVICLIVILIMH